MKTKTRNGLLAAGACCALAAPGAQSSVTLYGIIDTGVEYVSHANAAGDHLVRMPGVTGELPSRWAARHRGSRRRLPGGVHARKRLQRARRRSRPGGRLFGRQAFVGLKSGFGTLAFGRQYTMTYLALQGADIIGPDIYGRLVRRVRAERPRRQRGDLRRRVSRRDVRRRIFVRPRRRGHRQLAGAGHVRGASAGRRGAMPQLVGDAQVRQRVLRCGGVVREQRGGTGAAANFDGVAPVPFTSSGGRTHART